MNNDKKKNSYDTEIWDLLDNIYNTDIKVNKDDEILNIHLKNSINQISKKSISKKPISKKPISKKPISKKSISKKSISKKVAQQQQQSYFGTITVTASYTSY